MKVILKEDVESVGLKGDIKEVADGFARNFLLPRSLAVAATPGNIRNLEKFRESAAKKKAIDKAEAEKLAETIKNLKIEIPARAGERNRLFGSVTAQDVADFIEKETGIKIDKKKVSLGGDIKLLGKHHGRVTVYPEVIAEIEVDVTKIAEPEKEAKAEKKAKPRKTKEEKAEAAEVAETVEAEEAPAETEEPAAEEAPAEESPAEETPAEEEETPEGE